MNRPNFICVGAQKAGTTTLYDILYQHPQVFLTETKELHFFDWDHNYKQGESWYFDHFKDVKDEKAIGEITPNYMYIDYVPERIFKMLGKDLRLIFLLRNPMNRAFSHYLMKLRNARTKETFYKAAKIDQIKNREEFLADNPIIGKSLYDVQINRYLQYFNKNNMLFLIFESDLLKNKVETYKKICAFLEVDPVELDLEIQSNKASYIKSKKMTSLIHNENVVKKITSPLLPNKTKHMLKEFLKKLNRSKTISYAERDKYTDLLNNEIFIESVRNLEKIIDRDLSFWFDKSKKK